MTTHRILVVEDNERNLKLVRDVLYFAGFDVLEARSGEEGVALARQSCPDLVLMDLQLPGIDGTQALQLLRSSERTRQVPVVALTALAMREDKERALDAGSTATSRSPSASDRFPHRSGTSWRGKGATGDR
jgi:two-component system cell cycle response regulator DivK